MNIMHKINTIKGDSVPLLNENGYDDTYECPICFENYNDSNLMTTNCGHNFHTKCINIWLEENYDCPMCRQLICTTFNAKYIKNPFLPFFYKKCALTIDLNKKTILIQYTNKIDRLDFCDIKEIYLNRNCVVFNYRTVQLEEVEHFKKINYGFQKQTKAHLFFKTLIKIFKM